MRTQLAEAENLVSRIQNEINVMDVLNHVASRGLPTSNSDVDLITKILGDENNSIESKKNCLIYLAKIVQNVQVLEVSAIDKISDFIGSILSEQAISIFYYTKDSSKFSSTVMNKIRNELKKNTVENLIPGSNTQYNYRLNQINKRYDQAMKNQHKA